MISPYGTHRKCRDLSPAQLEETFFYPGPQNVRQPPGAAAQRAWDQAKEVCIECPVFLACRENRWGEEYGVVGGTDQYERQLFRRRQTRELRLMSSERRRALDRAILARAAGPAGDPPHVIARQTGYSLAFVKSVLEEHDKAAKAKREAAAMAARDAVGWTPTIVWPKGHPVMGDAWLSREGEIHAGHYVAQTRDGQWFRLKFRARKTPVIRWFPAAHVDLRVPVEPVYAERSKGAAGGLQAEHLDSGEPAAA